MSKSIISNERKCVVCGTTLNLHRHHVFYGVANRPKAEHWGCWVYLCARHHNMSNEGVHFNHELDLSLKKYVQTEFEKKYGHDKYMEVFGRNWLDDWSN